MKNKFKILTAVGCIMVLFAACKKDAVDTTPPATTSGLTATPGNQTVLLNWINPTDDDFAMTKITCNGQTFEAGKEEGMLIDGLENGTEYTFGVSTVDLLGNASEPVMVKSTPDKYVTKVEGRNIESGTYKSVGSTFPVTITINANNYKRTMSAGGTQYIWEGTWAKENDTTYLFDYEYYTIDFRGTVHVANLMDRYNKAFCYDYSDTTFYIGAVYEKIEGSEDFITGKYKHYQKTISDDAPSYSDTTYYYANFTAEGAITYTDSDNNTETASWKNKDLLDGKFLFVSLNSRIYLIDRVKWTKFMKQ